jgi:hypothetical protein
MCVCGGGGYTPTHKNGDKIKKGVYGYFRGHDSITGIKY